MTKKQLEKYRKEFDEFIANAEKLGARFLTEDELRYKINGGTDDFASDQTEATADGGDSYTVQSGDTLSEIVEDYNSEHGTDYTYQEIAEQNGIENPDLIYPWDEINFGGGNTKTETAEDEDVSGTKTQDADNLDENNDTTSEDEEATNEKSDVAEQKDETQTEKTSDDGKTSSGGDMTVDSKNLSYDSATGTFRSNPTLSDVKISPAKPEDNLAAAMEAANGKSKDYYDYDINASLSRSMEKNWIQSFAEEILGSNGIKNSGISILPGDCTKSGVSDVGLYNMGHNNFPADFQSRVITDNLGDAGFDFSLSYKHEF
ncbi:MAG: LysM peptidoglycan-binding domain-containing protein [Treponema sp.]|nr:LysM peptidoglycan-binding domain-containing protein [Treponema sp.]